MKVGAGAGALAAAMVVMAAGTRICDGDAGREGDWRHAPQGRLAGLTGAGEIPRNELMAGEENKASDTAQQSFDSLLGSARERLQRANTELQKTDAELNARKAMQSVDDAWADIIAALKSAGETGQLGGEVSDVVSRILRRAKHLAAGIAAKAFEIAKQALADAQSKGQDTAGRLLKAVGALENAEVVGNIEINRNAKLKHMRSASIELMRKSAGIVAGLVAEDARSDDETRCFCAAMKNFGERMQDFGPGRPHRGLLRSIEVLKRCAGKMGPDASVVGVGVRRVVSEAQKAVYTAIRGADAMAVPVDDENMLALVRSFDKAIGEAVDVVRFGLWNVEYVHDYAVAAIDGTNALDEARRMLSMRNARQDLNEMKEGIGAMKEKCRVASESFNKMVEAASAGLGQDFDGEAYVLRRYAMGRRRSIVNMLQDGYGLEESIAGLEQSVIERGRRIAGAFLDREMTGGGAYNLQRARLD